MSRKIPATIVTGFLGAGKTSLIRHLLAQRRRPAARPRSSTSSASSASTASCCSAAASQAAPRTTSSSSPMAASAAPSPTISCRPWSGCSTAPSRPTTSSSRPRAWRCRSRWCRPSPGRRCARGSTVDGVIAVVDAPAVAAGRFADDPAAVAAQRAADPALDHDSPLAELFEDQLACADLVILNKTDLLDADALARGPRPRSQAQLRAGAQGGADASGGALDPRVAARPRRGGRGRSRRPPVASRRGRGRARPRRFRELCRRARPGRRPGGAGAALRAVDRAARRPAGQGLPRTSPARRCGSCVQAVGGRLQRYFDRPWRAGEARAQPAGRDRPEGPRPRRRSARALAGSEAA